MTGLLRRKKVKGKKQEMKMTLKMIEMENFDARIVITFQHPKRKWKTIRGCTKAEK